MITVKYFGYMSYYILIILYKITWADATQSSMSSLNRVQKFLLTLVMYSSPPARLVPQTQRRQPFTTISAITMEGFRGSYIRQWPSARTIMPSARSFKVRSRYAMFTVENHPHSFCVSFDKKQIPPRCLILHNYYFVEKTPERMLP